MKNMKKFFAILLALTLVFAMGTSAFAAEGTGTITVQNATIGQNYAGYKIFDATYDGDTVAYTIDSSDKWYNIVSADGSPFELTQVGNTTTYNVAVADGKTDADILNWLQGQTVPGKADLEAVMADGTTVLWKNVAYGYYLITSDLNNKTVTVTNVNEDVTVIDKNQKPGWEDPDGPNDDDQQQGKNVSSDNAEYSSTSTSGIGDTAYFKVNVFAPKYNGENIVNQYTFTDALADGFTYNNDLVIKIKGETQTVDTDYSVTVNGQTITIVLNVYGNDDYPTDASVEMTYTAKVDTDAIYDNTNKIGMDWTEFTPDPANPTEPENPNNPEKADPEDTPEDSKTDTYVYGFNLQKYANTVSDENKLDGASFKLYDAKTDGNEIKVVKVSDGVYRVADAGEDGVEIEAGRAQIFGLKEGTYYLEETDAPDGYNPLTSRKIVTVGDAVDNGADVGDGYTDATVDVVNNSGTVLPETGGIGTTIFYIIGGLMMVGAVVLLVTKKKMSVSND